MKLPLLAAIGGTLLTLSLPVAATAQDGGRCFREVRGEYGMNDDRAVEVCRQATPYTASCFKQARVQFQVTDEEATALCRNATVHTLGCFIDTRAQYGVTDDQAIAVCKDTPVPGPYSDQIIIIERTPVYIDPHRQRIYWP